MDNSKIRAELERIRKRHGGLRARDVWMDSVEPDAPLHDRFTWDDTKAAALHRDYEARLVIQEVRVIGADDKQDGRFYVHVISGDDSRYEPINVVVANKDMYLFALGECEKALIAAKKRIADLSGAANIASKIDSSIRAVKQAQKTREAPV